MTLLERPSYIVSSGILNPTMLYYTAVNIASERCTVEIFTAADPRVWNSLPLYL